MTMFGIFLVYDLWKEIMTITRAFLYSIMGFFYACTTALPKMNTKEVNKFVKIRETPKIEKTKNEFHEELEISITLSRVNGHLGATILRPIKKSSPKTIVIMVPGSGNVSREGEVSSDGIKNFEKPILVTKSWAKSLTNLGFFTLSYDKRTCGPKNSPLCKTNPQKDIESQGIKSLSQDLDAVCRYVKETSDMSKNKRLVLFSTGQGAQVIAESECVKEAQQVILVSPLLEDLERTWVLGLKNLKDRETDKALKASLINKEESMRHFFSSLRNGSVPENSSIRGASISFWQSWIKSAKNTLNILRENHIKTLILYTEDDPYFIDFKTDENILLFKEESSNRYFINNNQISEKLIFDIKRHL